jgi:hypothetical protein
MDKNTLIAKEERQEFLSQVYNMSKQGAMDALQEAGRAQPTIKHIGGDITQSRAFRDFGRYDVEKWEKNGIVRAIKTGERTAVVLYTRRELEVARQKFGCAKDRRALREIKAHKQQ